MNRRDTIIVAVLINAGLLTILFATAMNSTGREQPETAMPTEKTVEEVVVEAAPTENVKDEVDLALEEHLAEKKEEPVATKLPVAVVEEPKKEKQDPGYVSVTVKKGDYLERIARANNSSVKAIMDANGLATTRLSIGQVLKVPTNKESKTSLAKQAPAPTKNTSAEKDIAYYTVASGDNPWLISKRTGVAFDDILRLNGLDEYKARQLKPGDRLRIR